MVHAACLVRLYTYRYIFELLNGRFFFKICLKNSDVVRIYHDHKNKILILIFFNKMFANSFDIVCWFSLVIKIRSRLYMLNVVSLELPFLHFLYVASCKKEEKITFHAF